MVETAIAERAWSYTMALLRKEWLVGIPSGPYARSRYFPSPDGERVIRVLEHSGKISATVAWSDSMSGCYGEQLWRRCIARRVGLCVLSGQKIAKGDAVYSPRKAKQLPYNSQAMILASVLEARPSDDLEVSIVR
jgi:hypothetical protein